MMVVDGKGKIFEDRRKNSERRAEKNIVEKRKKDRRKEDINKRDNKGKTRN